MLKILFRGAILVLGFTPFGAAAFPADETPAQSFLFVSANTRENMTDEAAWESLQSFEQQNFLAVEKYLAERLCSKPRVVSAEGMDGGSSENSSLVTGCGGGRARYVGELLARYAHQKWVLIFDPRPAAGERLLIVSFPSEHPQDTMKLLRQHGVMAATVVVEEGMVRVYVWAKDHSQDSIVTAFVQTTHGNLQELPGKATLIGNDSRSTAQHVFEQRIHAYESAHHQSFSRLLWSRLLHDLGLELGH